MHCIADDISLEQLSTIEKKGMKKATFNKMIAVPLTGFLDLIKDYMKQYVNTFTSKNDLSLLNFDS